MLLGIESSSLTSVIEAGKPTIDFGNDPAAGSPTATLLRLLLPLAEKYC